MPTVTVPAGTVNYRVAGPDDSAGPPVVFVHGFLVDSTLWDGVAERLATIGIRSYLVDWPLGSHRTAMSDDADLSPLGVARLVDDVLGALSLDDVTLVGNDTGGAICQLLMADDPSRIGRVVLTNCDAFENFPPRFFLPLFLAAKRTWLTRLLVAPMRLRALRHSPLGYGTLLRKPRDAALTRGWVAPAMGDAAIRRDIARFARRLDRRALLDATPRLGEFDRPVRVVWGRADRNFTLATARRLTTLFPDAELVEVPDVSTFVPIDAPQSVVDAIVAMAAQPQR